MGIITIIYFFQLHNTFIVLVISLQPGIIVYQNNIFYTNTWTFPEFYDIIVCKETLSHIMRIVNTKYSVVNSM